MIKKLLRWLDDWIDPPKPTWRYDRERRAIVIDTVPPIVLPEIVDGG